jgi:hypothetical protein
MNTVRSALKLPSFTSSEGKRLAVENQRKFIEECGGDLAGYIARYGDPGVLTSKGKPMYGNGGTAIYNADLAELKRLEARLG